MTLSLKPLDPQVVVITGASSGIGLATTRSAAQQGAKLFLVSRNEAVLRTIAGEINDAGGMADFAVADVGDMAQVEAAVAKAIDRYGRIDTFVSAAGSAIYAKLMETPLDEHEQLFRTNYFGVVHGSMAAVPRLMKQGGALIVVGSIASDMPTPVMGAYAASKHALKAYVEGLRMELQADGAPISVTLIKPAAIDTPVAQHASNKEGGEAQIPGVPAYHPQLVADAILYAAVHRRREITVGGVGRAQTLFARYLPVPYEWLAPKAARFFVDRDKTQPGPSNLFEAGNDGAERSGELPAKRTSLYTSAQLHPKTTAALMVGLVAGGAALWRMKGRADPE